MTALAPPHCPISPVTNPRPLTSQVYLRPLLLPLPVQASHLMDRVIWSLRTLPLYISSRVTFILRYGGEGRGGAAAA